MAIETIDSRSRGLRRRPDTLTLGAMLRRLDWVLVAALGATVGYGLIAIAAITRHDPGGPALNRQALYAAAGALLFVVILLIDPDRYRRLQVPIYAGTLGVMLLVLLLGSVSNGSKRWINVGFFTFQPSEFGKLVFVLALAGFLADRSKSIASPRSPLLAIGLGLLPILLVFVQPDIGTALVYAAALIAVLLFAGVRWLHLTILFAITVSVTLAVLWLLPAAGVNVLKPYQAKRLTGFTHPTSDPRGATYNVTESLTAVGSGGVRGRGVLGATQTRLDYLPAHETDFAFASLAEQRGFLGSSLLLLLYLLIVWRGFRIVTNARDQYSAIVAGAISFMFLFQVFVNCAMTMGIAPITGIPLPFLSVGGSSMIMNFMAIGVLQAIHMRSPGKRYA
jgi:rod shape determining protein RodA